MSSIESLSALGRLGEYRLADFLMRLRAAEAPDSNMSPRNDSASASLLFATAVETATLPLALAEPRRLGDDDLYEITPRVTPFIQPHNHRCSPVRAVPLARLLQQVFLNAAMRGSGW